MMNQRTHARFPLWLAALAAGLALLAWSGRAQPVVRGEVLKLAEYHDAPHETQMKSLLEGTRAQRQPDGSIVVTQAKCQTFSETGRGELVVEAPECVYDPKQRSINSAGPLKVQTADGRLAVEGEGFTWQQTNSTLLISNRVHTRLRPELFRPPSASPLTNPPARATPAMDIFSDRFEYMQTLGRGVYQGNVRVTGTNLNATAGKLTILLPLTENRLQSLTAEERVVVDYEKVHATGEWAFYSADTDLIQLKGQPTWRIEQQEGSASELVFDRTNRVFRANGQARLQMPAAGMGAVSFLSRPGSASADSLPPTNQFVEVRCDSYELRTNVAVFRDQVRVSDRLGDQQQGQMTCGLMTLTFAGTNELERLVAQQDVVISQADRRFTADKADYTASDSLLELTGNPAWQAGPREGKGDWMRVNLAREELLVRGNALMKLPAGEVGRTTLTGSDAPRPDGVKPDAPGFAEIFSKEYRLTGQTALFQGGVRIEHPRMKWTCDQLSMTSPPELGKDGRRMIAEPEVVFDMLDEQGTPFHGTGKKAVYTRRLAASLTNDLVELTGAPATVATTNIVIRNEIILLDISSHKLATPGKFNFRGPLPDAATNHFRSWERR